MNDEFGARRLHRYRLAPHVGSLFGLALLLTIVPGCLQMAATSDGGGGTGGTDDGGTGVGRPDGGGSPARCPGTPYVAAPMPTSCAGEAALGAPIMILGDQGGTSSAGGVTIATGDIDDDGNVDFATTLFNRLLLYFGTGSGEFSEPVRLRSQEFTTILGGPVALGDFNADGRLDVVAVGAFGTNDGFPAVWLNQGGRVFGVSNMDDSYNAYDAGGELLSNGSGGNMVVADLNGDGLSDLVYCGYRSRVYVSSCGALPGGVDLAVNDEDAYTVRNCVVTNLPDGDADPDLIVQLLDFPDAGRTAVLHGTGFGSFDRETDFVNFSEYAVLTDLTNDGLQDLALLDPNGGSAQRGSIGVMIGQPDGSFTLQPGTTDVTSGVPDGSGADYPNIIAADVTNDGNVDLGIIDTAEDGAWSLMRGNGDGTFEAEARLTHTVHRDGFGAFADFNNDGLPDFIVTDGTNVSVSLSRCR